jgi:hypothetical protein
MNLESPFAPRLNPASSDMITNEDLKTFSQQVYSPAVVEMAKELLERREKEAKEKQPKSLKAPMSDEDLEAGLKDYAVYRVANIQAVFRELLEYRRLTRRTHYQEGDFFGYSTAPRAASLCDGLVGTAVQPHYPCLIPLSNFAHLHND